MFKILQQVVAVFFLVLVVAGAPLILQARGEEVYFQPERFIAHAALLVENISDGTLGTYTLGRNERDIAGDILPFAENSFLLLFFALLIAVTISIIFGMFLHRYRVVHIYQRILDIISTVPDFVQVLFFMLAAIAFYKMTDIRLITLSPFSEANNNWFPTLILSVGPTLYLMKVVSLKYSQTCGEDYIRTALAKGMNVRYIILHHVFKNVKPFLIADMKKAISITIANLFVVEYLLNVVGVTRFIFGEYQFSTAAIGLMLLLVISLVVYMLIWLILYLFERGFIYE